MKQVGFGQKGKAFPAEGTHLTGNWKSGKGYISDSPGMTSSHDEGLGCRIFCRAPLVIAKFVTFILST